MKAIITAAFILFTSTAAMASIDWSQYQLTTDQLALMQRLEQRGLEEQVLRKFAESMSRKNNSVYIPEHTTEDLYAVTEWAEGGAYRVYAKDAGLEFDFQSYMADCPNMALFGFARATGTQHLQMDVLSVFTNTVFTLNRMLFLSPETFAEKYINAIQATDFAKYLKLESQGS